MLGWGTGLVTESGMRAVLDESLESDLSEHEIITIYRTFRSRPAHSLVSTSVKSSQIRALNTVEGL
jgi:hypothetical protein